jgi:hypothetical protein
MMPIPWLRLIDLALGVTNFAQARSARTAPEDEQLTAGTRALGHFETRLAGVVVAALREAFDRDSRRLDFEREQIAAEQRRAERALRMELVRQAGDREIGRLRLVAGVAIVSWIGTLAFSVRLIGGPVGARVALGAGWALLLCALAASFVAQANVGDALGRVDGGDVRRDAASSGAAGAMAPWLIVVGLVLVGLAVLIA